ncbi:MAG TPA: flagellar protein FlgN [Spirochaetota bacterium]|nr:flagellar protein FlgN [Spirochaetota bacterium]HNV46831.1 flagellar protein FlgN [Spirochaetota bacterium]
MSMAVRELERVLKNEVAIYHQLYDCEEEKGRAIIARDGALIERLSREQEELMRRLGALERERLALIDEYVRENRINELPGNVTLRQIVAQMDEDSSHRLLAIGMALRSVLTKIQSLQETNRTLLDDNIRFFSILLSTLKDTVSVKTGYSGSGVEESRVSQSLIFNRRF